MNQQSTFTIGMWAFLLAAGVCVAFLLLGTDLSKATWLNGDIAAAQAEQLSSQTMIERMNAELDYEQRKFYAELERQKAQQLAIQEIQSQAARDAEALAFQKNIHAAMAFGARWIAILFGLGLFVASSLSGIGLKRYLTANAQAKQSQPAHGKLIVKIEQLTRQVSTLQEKIAQLEQRQNHRAKEALKNTVREWPDDPEDYVSRLPPTWAG